MAIEVDLNILVIKNSINLNSFCSLQSELETSKVALEDLRSEQEDLLVMLSDQLKLLYRIYAVNKRIF